MNCLDERKRPAGSKKRCSAANHVYFVDGTLMPIKTKKSNKEGYENIGCDLFVCFQTGDRTPLFDLVSSDATIPDDTGAEAESLNEAKSQAW